MLLVCNNRPHLRTSYIVGNAVQKSWIQIHSIPKSLTECSLSKDLHIQRGKFPITSFSKFCYYLQYSPTPPCSSCCQTLQSAPITIVISVVFSVSVHLKTAHNLSRQMSTSSDSNSIGKVNMQQYVFTWSSVVPSLQQTAAHDSELYQYDQLHCHL